MALTIAPRETLTPDQHRRALLGRDSAVPRLLAFNLPATRDLPDAPELLRAIAEDRTEPARIRHLAVTTLYRLNRPEAEELLVGSAQRIDDERVLAAVAQSLGRIGSEKVLDTVRRIRARTRGVAAARAEFAAAGGVLDVEELLR